MVFLRNNKERSNRLSIDYHAENCQMKKFTADYIFTSQAEPIKNGSIVVDNNGKILKVIDPEKTPLKEANAFNDLASEKLSGVICPGFINTHCHLELSHLKGKIPVGEGLIAFIKNVQQHRKADDGEVLEAAAQADEEMWQNGIVAVGDIANSAVTASIKIKSKLYYHNFVEVFGFDPKNADAVFSQAILVRDQFKPMTASITPHAPYSVSKELFKLIIKEAEKNNSILSIHNQESDEENKLYRYKQGDFPEFYNGLGLDIDFFKPQARNSLQSIVPLLSNRQNVLMVHNTFTSMKDVYFTRRFDKKNKLVFLPGSQSVHRKRIAKSKYFYKSRLQYYVRDG